MKRRFFLLLGLLLVLVNICFSQTYIGQDVSSFINNAELVRYKNYSNVPNYVRFSANAMPTQQQAMAVVRSFITNANADLQMKEVQNNGDGSQTVRYYQTVSGYPIEYTALNMQVNNGKVTEFNGEILDNPQIVPSFLISEADALQFALNYVNAEVYMWQEDTAYCPHGERVVVPDKVYFGQSELKSAYKFNIYSLKPYDGKKIYVDAQTGEIILDIPLIHYSNVVGKAQTAYYGERSINTDYNSSTKKYSLCDSTRGKGIFTYNANDYGDYTHATNYSNDSSRWVIEQYATCVHFSTMMTYDYYLQKHGRNSINDSGFALVSYVNFNLVKYGYPSNVNAFWSNGRMTYGNGNPPSVTPLTTMDICGHEITHGLTEKTARLEYAFESGALNEAFSDIFGTAIEFFAVPEHANWTIGEKIGYTMRSMANPNLYKNPKTYQGLYWEFTGNDNGGVHTNSGVLNYWFYLLCEGGSGVNDLGNNYNVAGIGIGKAEQIAFKLLTTLLTPNSMYEDACFYGLQAATAIYGACSDELKAVGDAFYAVGLLERPYQKYAAANFYANITEHCETPVAVQFTNQSYNANTYSWDFGDGTPIVYQANPSHTYTANGTYTVTLIANGGVCGTDTIVKQNYINISPDLPGTYFMTAGKRTVTSCHGIVYDNGGQNKSHLSNTKSLLTIYAPGATSIILNIAEFDLEGCSQCTCDFLSIYRGADTLLSTRVGKYCNTNYPNSIITVTGERVTLYFYSDPYVNLNGFKIEYACVNSSNPPVAIFSADITKSCDGAINFKDQSVSAVVIDSWLWNFGDGTTSTLQNPTHQYYKNGKYTVSLTVRNAKGQHTATKNDYIVIENMNKMDNLLFSGEKGKAFEISVPDASSNLKWYENEADIISGATPIFTGNPILHPAISEEKTYHLFDEINTYHVGDTARSTKGSFFVADVIHYLNFDVYQSFNLKSVVVNANSNGNRTIMLRDAGQNLIWVKSVYIPSGISRIIIDKEVPQGKNLQLACSATPGLFRSDNTANLNYPYTVKDILSIKSSSAAAPDDLKYYYFFYDWEIKIPTCNSEPFTATIFPDTLIALFNADVTKSCDGTINFKDQSVGSQINSWSWDFGDGTTSSLQNPTHQYYKNGIYTVSLAVKNAKRQHSLTKNDYISIENMTNLGDHQFEGSSEQAFEIAVPNASSNLKWYEDKEDNLSGTTPAFTGNLVLHPAVLENKKYYILDEVGQCKSELSTVTITTDLSVEDHTLRSVSILPNPSSGIFRIENLQNAENHSITVSEVTGKILNAPHLINGNIIDLSPFATGIYFVRIDEKVFKVVKY